MGLQLESLLLANSSQRTTFQIRLMPFRQALSCGREVETPAAAKTTCNLWGEMHRRISSSENTVPTITHPLQYSDG